MKILPAAVPFIKTTKAMYKAQAKKLKDSGQFDTLPLDTQDAILKRLKALSIDWNTL